METSTKKQKWKDRTGIKTNYLTALRVSDRESSRRRKYWWYRCDCGVEKEILAQAVNQGETKSCGCLGNVAKAKSANKPGVELAYLLRAYKGGAKLRGLVWELTEEQVLEIVGRNCIYCNNPPPIFEGKAKHSKTNAKLRGHKSFVEVNPNVRFNGIDRVDSNQGYVISNVAPCCRDCNLAKQRLSQEEFIDLCKRVAGFSGNMIESPKVNPEKSDK